MWVELNRRKAEELGIGTGDWVWVESEKGRIRVRAKLYSWTRRDVVHIPLMGRGENPNPNDLIANEPDIFRGFGLFNTTRVRIRRA
jgi:anaerobic selenocysteine-containing dehydrogenase